MTTYGTQVNLPVVAGADLTAKQYRGVRLAGTSPVSGQAADVFGIIQNKPNTNEHATVCVFGESKLYFALAITAGTFFGFNDSGEGIPAAFPRWQNTGSGTVISSASALCYGRAIIGCASGGLAHVLFESMPSGIASY